jgi:hypothetical protein
MTDKEILIFWISFFFVMISSLIVPLFVAVSLYVWDFIKEIRQNLKKII